MSFDVVMIVTVLAGVVLSLAYLAVEYHQWRRQGIADRAREAQLRELHAERLADPPVALANLSQLKQVNDGAAANPDGASRPTAIIYPFEERRKRPRRQVAR